MKFKTSNNLIIAVVSAALVLSCSKDNERDPSQEPIVIRSTGDINPALEQFRQLLGDQLNTTPGTNSGRREINWDGIPDELLNKDLPLDFFNQKGDGAIAGNQRGLLYASNGSFRVSKTGFAEVNALAAVEFTSFSGNRSFANISGNLWDVEFEVPGQAVTATVQGFGIVFSDVDADNSTALEFFNDQRSLGKFFVPAKDGSNFSFLGVYFPNEKVTRVQISHDGRLDDGEADISADGPTDLVTMDNFLYSEPVKF